MWYRSVPSRAFEILQDSWRARAQWRVLVLEVLKGGPGVWGRVGVCVGEWVGGWMGGW